MKKLLLVISVSTLFTGCASVMNDVNHPVKLETKTADGKLVTGAECKMINDFGSYTVKSGESVSVHRSGVDLQMSCVHPESGEAKGRAISRVNGGMFGNILIGGGIGAVIDHNRGTAYTYPTWMQLVFGKELVFDRSYEKEEKSGQPVPPIDAIVPVATK